MGKYVQKLSDLWQERIIWFLAGIYVKFLLLKRRWLNFIKTLEKETIWTLARIYVSFLKRKQRFLQLFQVQSHKSKSKTLRPPLMPAAQWNGRRIVAISLAFLLLLPVLPSSHLSADASGYTILNNGRLTFGNGSENSVNTNGNLQQPFYYNQNSLAWYKLTFGTSAMASEIAEGGDGSVWWNRNGNTVMTPTLQNFSLNLDGFVSSNNGANGYGTVIATGTATVGEKTLEIRNTYELPQSKAYIKVTTRFRNTSGQSMTNLRYWVGTQDDWIGMTDSPTKVKGNLVDGAFEAIGSQSEASKALKIYSGNEGVMFYTDTDKANLIIASHYGWSNATSLNPINSPTSSTGDQCYAFYVRLNDLSAGQTDEISWYYAAGELAELTQTIAEVAQASGAISNITYTSADFTANSSTSGTGYYLVVPQGATAPTEDQIAAGVSYGAVTVKASGNGSITANVARVYSIADLEHGISYDLHFVVKNGANYSAISTTSFTTTAHSAPGQPRNATASAGDGTATVSFDPPTSNGGEDITGYTVTSNPGGKTATGTSSPITVTGLTNGTSYTFVVTATNPVGTGSPSSSTSSVTPNRVSDPPTELEATSENGQAIITFNAPSDNGGSTITSYTVTASPGGITASGSTSPITVTGLTNGTAYSFTAVANNSNGHSVASSESNQIIPATTPGTPQNISALAGNGEASVSFDSPANNGGLEVSSYTVTTNPGGITVTGTSSPITVTGLSNGTSYSFSVVATNALGNSQASSSSNVVTPKRVSDPPTNVSVLSGNEQATITFDTPADNGGSSITGYTATASPGGITASNTASPITMTGLTNGIMYTFFVVATNPVGNSLPSTESNSVTPATIPDAPTNLYAKAGDGEATVTFDVPANNGGVPITNYTVTASPGGITSSGSSNSIIVTGLTNGTTYTFSIVATNLAGNSATSLESGPITPIVGRTTPTVQSLIKMEGVSFNPGTVQTNTISGAKAAIIDATSAISTKVKQLVEAIKAITNAPDSEGSTGTGDADPTGEATPTKPTTPILPTLFPDPTHEVKIDLTQLRAEKVDVILTADVVAEMGTHDMTLNVMNGEVSHLIPAKDINVAEITGSMGLADQPEKVEIKIQIESPSTEIVKQIQERAEISGYEIVLPSMNFEVRAVNLETKEENTVKRFTSYVGRVFEIPEGVDPTKITTGIVVNGDGTFSHVPTTILESNGTYYARINSLTNSTYSVIWHPFAFVDMESHWAKVAANDLGARLVVNGDESGALNPDETITRGEFISMLTNALGIFRAGEGSDRFVDVTSDHNEYDAISLAAEYGLVSGYPDGTFRPSNNMTREEMMVALAKAATLLKLQAINEKTMKDYLDSMQVAAWAKPFIDQNITTGVVIGNNGKLRPMDYISRAEALSAMERMLVNAGLIN